MLSARPTAAPIPVTSFVCPEYQGLFADVETNCRLYHQCYGIGKVSRWCGEGTVFNQEKLACDYPFEVNCEMSVSLFARQRPTPKPSTTTTAAPKATSPIAEGAEEGDVEDNADVEEADDERPAEPNSNKVAAVESAEAAEEPNEDVE